MRRRRGLLGTAARTAVIAGTATSVSGRVARGQQQKFARQTAQQQSAELRSVAPRDSSGGVIWWETCSDSRISNSRAR